MASGPSQSFPSAFPATPLGGANSGAPATGFAFGGGAAAPAAQQPSKPFGFGGAASPSPASPAPAAQQAGANPFGFGGATAPQAQARMEPVAQATVAAHMPPAIALAIKVSLLSCGHGAEAQSCVYRVEGFGLACQRRRQHSQAIPVLALAVPSELLAAPAGVSNDLSAKAPVLSRGSCACVRSVWCTC
jgi:hypothetical protein